MKILWLKSGLEVFFQNEGQKKVISSFNESTVYYSDGGWNTVEEFTKCCFPVDPKVLSKNGLPKWIEIGLVVRPYSDASKKFTINSWDKNHVFYREGGSDQVIRYDCHRHNDYMLKFSEPKKDCEACWE